MNTPLLTWIVVISSQVLLIVAFIIHSIKEKKHENLRHAAVRSNADNHHRHIITVGSEREEFYCPGDVTKIDSNDWNNQDID